MARHGPDSIAFLSSCRCTNEENYLMQKVARAAGGGQGKCILSPAWAPSILMVLWSYGNKKNDL